MVFADSDPFGITVWISEQMLTSGSVKFEDSSNVPLLIDGPEDSDLFVGHTFSAVSAVVRKQREVENRCVWLDLNEIERYIV